MDNSGLSAVSRAFDYFGKYSAQGAVRLEQITRLQWQILGNSIHLVASACYPFSTVLQALSEPSFVLGAEGLPGGRYLPGSAVMDLVEVEGEALTLRLFDNPSGYRATLQPHSGTQANQIVYNAVLGPDDIVLCLKPRDGGHISHSVLIGRRNRTYNYGLTASGSIDYDQLRDLARAHRPRLIIVGGSALPRQIDFARCGEIAREYGALLHADISHTATFIAAGLHPSIFPACDFATFNTVKNLRGPNGGILVYSEDLATAVHGSIFPTTQGGANETTMLGKFAALLEWSRRDIRDYAAQIVRRARALATVLQEAGIELTTDGTDCHILLVELRNSDATGADLERRFHDAGVLLNKNLIPNDPRSPLKTSGLRIGVTNLSILGYCDGDLRRLGQWIAAMIQGGPLDPGLVADLTSKYYWTPECAGTDIQ